MTAGLPGTGVGGLFYLLAALLIPLWEFVRLLRGRGDRERRSLGMRQFGMAVGIVAGIWIVGWALGLLAGRAAVIDTAAASAGLHPIRFLTVSTLVVTVGSTAFVLAGTEVLRAIVHWRRSAGRSTGSSPGPMPYRPLRVMPSAAQRRWSTVTNPARSRYEGAPVRGLRSRSN